MRGHPGHAGAKGKLPAGGARGVIQSVFQEIIAPRAGQVQAVHARSLDALAEQGRRAVEAILQGGGGMPAGAN